jgi:branched-chain amino acid transport system ATP-binding protein
MIKVESISTKIGSNRILHDISFEVCRGQITAVIGANGAGKTTLLRSLSGLISLESGYIEFDGKSITNIPAHKLSLQGLVHIPQGRQIIPGLSVRDNLILGASNLIGKRSEMEKDIEMQFARFPILREREAVMGTQLSGGEQQMLAVARGLMMKPKVLMLDEPSLGLAPQIVHLILRTLRELASEGLAIILVEQAAMLALEYADEALVLRNGRCVMKGNSRKLLSSSELVSSYLS